MSDKNGPQKLIGEVRMLRIRVAGAESKLKVLREQARQAKRRRKEAKRLAQQARRQFKRFKAELGELQEALAKTEAKLFQAGGRALARKAAKAGPGAKSVVRPSKPSKTVAPSKPRLALPRKARKLRRVAKKKPASSDPNSVSHDPPNAVASDHTPPATPIPDPNS